jgi:predicted nucleic acid binding AN1-type Zn finger protein
MGDSMNVRALLRELTPQMGPMPAATNTPETISLEPASKSSNRCGTCRKKLLLSDIECRCKQRFCAAHRAPEEHACSHDFKADGQKILKQQLERVVAEKVERI